MQHPRADLLRQQARKKRRRRPPTTPHRGHERQTGHLQLAAHQLRKHGHRAGVHGAQEQADDGNGDGVADDVGEEPDEELEAGGSDDEAEDGAFLAEPVAGVREEEAAEGDAGPEAGRDVADAGRGGVAVGDEEGDDPAGDGDFGALVGEDEEGAEDGGFVAEGLFEELRFGGGVARAGRCWLVRGSRSSGSSSNGGAGGLKFEG